MRSADTRSHKPQERVVDFDTALAVVVRQAEQVICAKSEQVSLVAALGRVLAEPVAADRDQPPFPRSTRDGFAVRAEELRNGERLAVIGQVRAGREWQQPMAPGATVEIMTGAPVPSDADAVVMLEHVEQADGGIQFSAGRGISAGENIVPRGSEAKQGDVILGPGTVLGPAAIALGASCGYAALTVYAKPEVAILATGDELVDLHEVPGPSQIRNSNSYGLAALVEEAGGAARVLPTAKDTKESLEDAIAHARSSDLLLLSGGVSMGEYDLVEDVLLAMGAEFYFTGVKMQPGKPVVFGRLPERDGRAAVPFFGLPGNPVSTQVTFACFVEPLLRAMRGAVAGVPRFVLATLAHDVAGRAGLTRVLPARLVSSRTAAVVELVVWQGSGDMAANARANCYAVLPDGVEQFHKGDVISILVK